MPSIPRYEPDQVRQSAVSGQTLDVRVPLNNPVADAAQNLGETANAYYSKRDAIAKREAEIEKRKQQQLASQDADRQGGEWENQALYDPQTGAFNTRGKDALGLRDKVLPEFDKAAGKIAQGVADPEARAAVERMMADRRVGIERSLEQHTAQQMKVFDAESTQAAVATSQEAATANYQDEGRVAKEVARQHAVIADQAMRDGTPPELVALRKLDASTATHGAVIERMLTDGDEQKAAQYYARNKGQIAGGAQATIEKALEISSTRGKAQGLSDSIVATSPTQAAALAETAKIEDPKIREMTEARVAKLYAMQEDAKRADERTAFEEGYKTLRASPNDKGIDGVPPTLLARMSPEQRQTLESYDAKGGKIVNNSAVYYDLERRASNPAERAAFIEEDLLKHRADLDDAHFDRVVNLQASLREKANDKDGQEAVVAGINSREEVIDALLRPLGLPGHAKAGDTSADAAKVDKFRAQLDAAVIANERQTGKKMSAEDVKKVGARLVANVSVPGSWFGTNTVPAFQADHVGEFAFTTADVPADKLQAIRDSAKRQGKALRDEQIVDLYNQWSVNKKYNPQAQVDQARQAAAPAASAAPQSANGDGLEW